jgi:hypothetical protein
VQHSLFDEPAQSAFVVHSATTAVSLQPPVSLVMQRFWHCEVTDSKEQFGAVPGPVFTVPQQTLPAPQSEGCLQLPPSPPVLLPSLALASTPPEVLPELLLDELEEVLPLLLDEPLEEPLPLLDDVPASIVGVPEDVPASVPVFSEEESLQAAARAINPVQSTEIVFML